MPLLQTYLIRILVSAAADGTMPEQLSLGNGPRSRGMGIRMSREKNGKLRPLPPATVVTNLYRRNTP